MDQLHVLSSHISLVLSTPQDLEHLEIRTKTHFISGKRLGTVVNVNVILTSRGVDLPECDASRQLITYL